MTINLPPADPVHYMRIHRATLQTSSEMATGEHEEETEQLRQYASVDISRLTSVSFSYRELRPKADPSSRQPVRTVTYDLTLTQHPPSDMES